MPFETIAQAWLDKNRGGAPKQGERNVAYYELAAKCMRYLCDYNADVMLQVMPTFGLGETERKNAIAQACGKRQYYGLPKTVQALLAGLGIDISKKAAAATPDWDSERWEEEFKPFCTGALKHIIDGVPSNCRLNAFLAACSMFGTLMSQCRLKNWYDGTTLYITFMTYIIGDAASGKGVYRELDDIIMEALRVADEAGRRAEQAYQEEMKRRQSSTKASKEAPLEEKHYPVRYLPTNTTAAQKLERCRHAVMQIGATERQVACYSFETELSSKLNFEKSQWAASQDFDKKSFDCELTGSESRSSMTSNGLVRAFYNFVATGTPDAFQRKVTLANCLDGLPSRLLMCLQPPSAYTMVEKKSRARSEESARMLKRISERLMKLTADLDLEQKVKVPAAYSDLLGAETSVSDALYNWCARKAEECSEMGDEVGDYFRRRAPIIAARLAAVRMVVGSMAGEQAPDFLPFTFSDVRFALWVADYVFEMQMYFFSQLVRKGMDSISTDHKVYRNVRREELFGRLPDTFSIGDVMRMSGVKKRTACNIVSVWSVKEYVKRWKKGSYYKVVEKIV